MDLITNSPPKQRLDLFYRGRSKTYKGSNYYAPLYNKPITAIETPNLHQECVHTSQSTQYHDLRQRTTIRIPRLQRHHRLVTDQT